VSPLHRQRRRNYNLAGQAHVLTFSCYHGYQFLRAERTSQWLAEAIDAARGAHNFSLWAYVFMPEHTHLLLYPNKPDYDIARIRHAIKHPVGERAIRFLERESPEWLTPITRRRGKKSERLFWQSGGGYDRNIDNPKALASEAEYIHMNPVRRGLVERAQDWKWSSAGWYLGTPMNQLGVDPIPPEWCI
jgi:putative transposase